MRVIAEGDGIAAGLAPPAHDPRVQRDLGIHLKRP
jgi:hypothetical protein